MTSPTWLLPASENEVSLAAKRAKELYDSADTHPGNRKVIMPLLVVEVIEDTRM